MLLKKIWDRFTSKGKRENEKEIATLIAGAIVKHHSPFETIKVPRNKGPLSLELIEKWVSPYYINIYSKMNDSDLPLFAEARHQIDKNVVSKLLGDFNWRMKICGAYFSAINNYVEFEDVIGNLLIKSEVCYAGTGYSIALAAFNTEKSKMYLQKYLSYYLERKDLWFDQAQVLSALTYLDPIAATKFDDKWNDFVADKPYWNLERSIDDFKNRMQVLEQIRSIK